MLRREFTTNLHPQTYQQRHVKSGEPKIMPQGNEEGTVAHEEGKCEKSKGLLQKRQQRLWANTHCHQDIHVSQTLGLGEKS